MVLGNRGFAGNLVAMRDGLIVTHAAVYDPTLLKPIESIHAVADAATNRFRLSKGHVTFGQHVKLKYTSADTVYGALKKDTIYKVKRVYGPKGNEFTLIDSAGTGLVVSADNLDSTNAANYVGDISFELVVPFIFPKDQYDPDIYGTAVGGQTAGAIQDTDNFPEGMVFPYMYSNKYNLKENDGFDYLTGYINTATDIGEPANLNTMCTQIDNVNFEPEYINWIKNNVRPEFYGVYDYRVPRSRFSHDILDGIRSVPVDGPEPNPRVYSDVATGESGIARPGQHYVVDGVIQKTDSLYKFDFTKVTMLKIEFSWYGAVGALFLAYVPVENGEARWVRVHHLRASNQMKISSLGNATLPITYTVYGGGDEQSLGLLDEDVTSDQGYGAPGSDNIIKYGASYYIDGGDRGTVRLYSHNNEEQTLAYGKQWGSTASLTNVNLDGVSTPCIPVSGSTIDGSYANIKPSFFMGATFRTANSADQNIKVIFANETHAFLSATPVGTGAFKFLADRANSTYGLETKKVILSASQGEAVRNRVQVYPTKLSTSNTGGNPVRLRFRKTPIFQTSTVPNGTLKLTTDYTVDASNAPLAVTESAVTASTGTYLIDGEEIYGWFRATVDVDRVTIFGRLYRTSDSYYFELLQSFNGIVILKNIENFLPDKRWTPLAEEKAGNVVTRGATIEKEGLSSVVIANDTVVPIPGTGINVATIYLQQGTEQIDLSPYFDYNKEYLSFPLTDQADTLYFTVDSDTAVTPADAELISLGVTWEEQ